MVTFNMIQSGYSYNSETGVWSRPEFQGISYNDGDDIEQRLLSIIEGASDRSVLSMEFRQHCTDWPSQYHLSSSRANILRPLGAELQNAKVLEVGAGCGAVTRYLGESGADVFALEGSVRRAQIARTRTKDLENVVVVAESFDELVTDDRFDLITFVGVLEYASIFTSGDQPVVKMLERARSFLKPGGRLVIAIENQMGLKYFAGMPEDHVGIPMWGIEDRYRPDQAKTFGHHAMLKLLDTSGFRSIRSYLPFPDYKFPTSIVSELALEVEGFDAAALAWQSVRKDPQFPPNVHFAQELAWPLVFQNKLALALSNSLLLIAQVEEGIASHDNILAYHFSTDRRRKFAKETLFKLADDDSIRISCARMYADEPLSGNGPIKFQVPNQDYVSGAPLSWHFIKTVTADGWSTADITEFFQNYRSIILQLSKDVSLSDVKDSAEGDFALPGEFLDIIPQNIIVPPSGQAVAIDVEWRADEPLQFSQLVFRALVALSGVTSFYGKPASERMPTWDEILRTLFSELKLDWSPAKLIAFEAAVQEAVTGVSSAQRLAQWLESSPVMRTNPTEVMAQNLAATTALAERDTLIEAHRVSLEALNSQHQDLKTRLESLQASAAQQVEQLQDEVTKLRSSTSWRVTAPMRHFSRYVIRGRSMMKVALTAAKRIGFLRAVSRAMTIIRKEGVAGLKWRLKLHHIHTHVTRTAEDDAGSETVLDYSEWIRRYDTISIFDRPRIRSRIDRLSWHPTFSLIMPVFDPPLELLDDALWSVRRQLYPHWELCIADDFSKNERVRDLLRKHAAEDDRIRVVFRASNGHISRASNSALELATGDFIAMFDHDDLLPEHALYMFAEELHRKPDLEFIYSDQDKIDLAGHRFDPYFKPDFNPDLLRSQNFVDHLAVFRTVTARNIGGWRSQFDGSQDYDFVLRFTERLPVEKIAHIPHVLYHWRAVPGSLAIDAGAKSYAPTRSREALREHLARMGVDADVTSDHPELSVHRVIYNIPSQPLVSIIIPNKDNIDLISQLVQGIFERTDYSNFEIIIVDNQSTQNEVLAYYKKVEERENVRIIYYDAPFNYSKMNNLAAANAKGSVLALLNNDVEIIDPGWLREMVSHAVRPGIGAVGAKLLYPDGTVQHAGVLIGYRGRAGHMYRYAPRHWLGYWARAALTQNLTAVTAACLVIRKEAFDEAGGFDEENFTITFNDVDLCLRIHESGLRNLYTPFAELYHHESKTRGLQAIEAEEQYFANRWRKYIENDPAYNPNLSLEREDFSLAFPPRAPKPWNEGPEGDRNARPLVSIITRTYGERREFLKMAVESVIRQTYRPIQLVVVEDGTSNSRDFVEGLDLPADIKVDYHALPKKGRCFAGNTGLELAQGELIGFLDDDDVLLPDHVQRLVEHLRAHPNAGGAYSSSLEVPTEVVSLNPLRYSEGSKAVFGRAAFSLAALWNYNYIAIQSLLFKKDLYLEHGGLAEELDCLEDWDLWLRFTSKTDFVFLDAVTSEFRMPRNQAILEERRAEHLRYLPVLRNRQNELLRKFERTEFYDRLKAAFDTIG